MTGNTSHVHLVDKRVVAVAIAADQLTVFSIENKVSVSRVIKARVVPVGRVMTALALLSATAVVRIVLLVA